MGLRQLKKYMKTKHLYLDGMIFLLLAISPLQSKFIFEIFQRQRRNVHKGKISPNLQFDITVAVFMRKKPFSLSCGMSNKRKAPPFTCVIYTLCSRKGLYFSLETIIKKLWLKLFGKSQQEQCKAYSEHFCFERQYFEVLHFLLYINRYKSHICSC